MISPHQADCRIWTEHSSQGIGVSSPSCQASASVRLAHVRIPYTQTLCSVKRLFSSTPDFKGCLVALDSRHWSAIPDVGCTFHGFSIKLVR